MEAVPRRVRSRSSTTVVSGWGSGFRCERNSHSLSLYVVRQHSVAVDPERLYGVVMLVGVALIVAAWSIVYAWSVATALIMTFLALVTPLSAFLFYRCFGGRARLEIKSGSLAPARLTRRRFSSTLGGCSG
jgi:hypothetical protein